METKPADPLREVREAMLAQYQLLIGNEMSAYVRRQLDQAEPFPVIGAHARTGLPRRLMVAPLSLAISSPDLLAAGDLGGRPATG